MASVASAPLISPSRLTTVTDEPETRVSPSMGPEITIKKVASSASERCRCGTRLPAGADRFVISNPPSTVEYLVSSQAFCSVNCVQAFLLESMAEMESLASSAAEQTVIDIRDAYLDLSRTFDELRSGPSGRNL